MLHVNRWYLVAAILVGLGVIAGAGYLGLVRSRQPTAVAQATPTTIPVTRGDVDETVTATGNLISTREMTLAFGVAGRVTQLSVRPGDPFKTGQVLAAIDDGDLQSALRVAQANLAAAQSAYDAAVNKDAHRTDSIRVARAALDKAAAALQSAQSAYDRVSSSPDIGMLPQSSELQNASADYASALGAFNLAVTDLNDSAVKAAAQTLAQAQDGLRQAQSDVDHAKIVAPYDGLVLEVFANPGESVSAAQNILHLADPNALEARATITEEDYPLTRVGQAATLYLDAQPSLVIAGTVAAVVPLRDSSSASPVYPVYISFDPVPPGLAAGMSVDGAISIATRSNVLRLPRALVNARADGTAELQMWSNNRVQSRSVVTGLRGDQYVEIVSGVSEGEQVVSR